MSHTPDLERHGAQALLATYLQMSRYAQLARSLQQSRERSIERRLEATADPTEVVRLQQQLDAQHRQGAALEGAAGRFETDSKDLSHFAEAGVTYEDFQEMGAEALVNKDDVEARAAKRATEKQEAPE